MAKNELTSHTDLEDAKQKVERAPRAAQPDAGFVFNGKQTLNFLTSWYLPEGRPCSAVAILEALHGFLTAAEGGAADAYGAEPVLEWGDHSALQLATSSAVGVALGLDLRSARLRTPVGGKREQEHPMMVRPLRSGGSYDFIPVGALGMSQKGIAWRQALSYRAADYGVSLRRGKLSLEELDFDSTFGFGLKPESLSSEWARFDHMRSAAECDLWWLLGLLKPAVMTLTDKLLRRGRLTTCGVRAVIGQVAGNSGLRAIEERTWRSRIAFGLPLAAVNHTLAELGIDAQPRPRRIVPPSDTWPMTANPYAN